MNKPADRTSTRPGAVTGESPGDTTAAACLNTEPNLASPDDFYEALIGIHRDLTDAQSALLNAKLILLLANHIGDEEVLLAALKAAREDIAPD